MKRVNPRASKVASAPLSERVTNGENGEVETGELILRFVATDNARLDNTHTHIFIHREPE